MAELAPDFDCAAVDLPGSGFSPPPKTGAGYSVTAHAAIVARLIETLDAGPVHLVGNSMGGAVAVRVAARRPELVRTLTLISPALPDRKPRGSVAHFPVLALPFLGTWIIRHYSARYPVENRVSGVFATCFYDPARVHPDRVALEVEALRRRDGLSYEATSLARAARTLTCETLRLPPFSLWRDARRVTAPSLVLFGSHDRMVDPRLAARAASTFRDATVAVLPETGHLAQMERPDLVTALFREMVEETRARGAASAETTQVPG
jgi:pimeloyl-ACP methyl ester carboxylesterase